MYKTVSTVVLVATILVTYFFINKAFLAATNHSIWQVLAWAWKSHPSGKAFTIFFGFSALCFWVTLISWIHSPISMVFSTPKAFVKVGEETLDYYDKFYALDDDTREIVRLPDTTLGGGDAHHRYSSRLDLFFKKHIFLASDLDESTYSAARNHNILPSIFLSLATYAMLVFMLAGFKNIAHDYMIEQQREVTSIAAIGEFLPATILLFFLNVTCLTATFMLFKFKVKPHLKGDFQTVHAVNLKPGDQLKVEVLEHSIIDRKKVEQYGSAYRFAYLETVLQLEGAPSPIYPLISFAFKRTRSDEIEAFLGSTNEAPFLDVEVSETMTLMPVDLLGNTTIEWEDY